MKIIIGICLLVILGLSVGAFSEPQIVTDIKNGDKQLECNFNDGWRLVDGSKVVGIDDNSNRWIFTNGSVAAKNCEVY
jgi:hypothetical protein